MDKKLLRKIGVVLGIAVGIIMIANLSLNLWLNNSLPSYIKNNTDYQVSYKTLNVELISGNIRATGIQVASKDPKNQNVVKIDGTVHDLQISRLGIWDALVNKVVASSNFTLVNPNIQIILSKPRADRGGKRNPIRFKNINIKNGNVHILRHNNQKFLSVKNLNLEVANLKLAEHDSENNLPVIFDQYSIEAKNLYFRPDNIYVMKAHSINTEKGNMSIHNFELIPLLSYAQFTKFYPKKRNLFDFKTKEVNFKDIVFKGNKIGLSKLKFSSPHLKMFTTNVKPEEKSKSFRYVLNMDDVEVKNAKIDILKPNGSTLFSASTMDMDLSKMMMDDETAKGNIPFSYDKFLIKGKEIQYNSETQNVDAAFVSVDPTFAEIQNIVVKPSVASSSKSLADFTATKAAVQLNEWKFHNNKLKLDAERAWVTGLKGKIISPEKKQNSKPSFDKLIFPFKIKNIHVISPEFSLNQGEQVRTFNNLVLKVQNLEINEQTIKKNLPFKMDAFSSTASNITYLVNKFYILNTGLMKMNKTHLQINNFAMKPRVSRAEFIRMIPVEKDLFNLKATKISANGNWEKFLENQYLHASKITIDGLHANIFRSKIPKDDPSVKPMLSERLRKIKFPLIVDDLDINNSVLEYEEDSKNSWGPGKLTFAKLNAEIKNINSAKAKGQPTQIPITLRCLFMNASPMNVKWNMDTASNNDAFTISGNIADLPATRINEFIEPYLRARATGTIQDLIFDFKGSVSAMSGTMKMKHKDLKVSLLRESGEKKKLLSAIVNVFVKSDSGKFPESVDVEVKRDPEKSFFNMFWKGIQDGLKKTLIGTDVEKTINNTKSAVKEGKQAVKEVANKVKSPSKELPKVEEHPKKENIFKRIFKKKEKAEN